MNPVLQIITINRVDEQSTALGRTRKLVLGALLCTGLITASSSVLASDRRVATERFTEYAPVVNVQPIYREVRNRAPEQECWVEQQQVLVGYEDVVSRSDSRAERYRSQNSTGDVIVGSVIGGVIGNQLARGNTSHSRTGATVAGAIIGAAIGSEAGNSVSRHRRHEQPPRHIESRPIYETREVERCNRSVSAHSEKKLQHYNVTYRYKGREFVTQLPRDPGDRIELQVSVSPARR